MSLPTVSVVIPTHGRPQLLHRCLVALLQQEYPRDQYEIVVVEDGGVQGSLGETERVVRALHAQHPSAQMMYVAVEQGGPGAARNAGVPRASGHVIAFTDDDTIPDRRWLAEGAQAVEDGADAVSGRTMVPLTVRPTDAEANVQGLERASFPTCNVFITRAWLDRVGGFDPDFRRAYREDSDLEFRLLDAGARIVRANEAVVIHPPRQERPFVSLRQQGNQFYDALLYRKHPQRFRDTIRKCAPYHYYAITLAQFGGALALFLGRPRIALLAGAMWGAMTGRFFVQRAHGRSRDPLHLAELALTSVLIPPLAVYWRLRGARTFGVRFL